MGNIFRGCPHYDFYPWLAGPLNFEDDNHIQQGLCLQMTKNTVFKQ